MKFYSAYQIMIHDHITRTTRGSDLILTKGGISRQDFKDGIPFLLGLAMLLFIMLSIGGY